MTMNNTQGTKTPPNQNLNHQIRSILSILISLNPHGTKPKRRLNDTQLKKLRTSTHRHGRNSTDHALRHSSRSEPNHDRNSHSLHLMNLIPPSSVWIKAPVSGFDIHTAISHHSSGGEPVDAKGRFGEGGEEEAEEGGEGPDGDLAFLPGGVGGFDDGEEVGDEGKPLGDGNPFFFGFDDVGDVGGEFL
mmetsp:Transcript_31855/g.66454  ORF Transcript_31855/g.66454 Transcript_31855/m.66454 type:complete len:189 (+) Transcript_31855:173-739(+)